MLSPLQNYIHKSRYARWLEDQKCRETWTETVNRYVDYFTERYPNVFPRDIVTTYILNMEAMPSMRAMMTAGEALTRDEMAGFNCSYVAVDDIRVFDEILYVLMCGTGVGFSVERQHITNLPVIPQDLRNVGFTIVVEDSKVGWASAYKELIDALYSGKIPAYDTSRVRPAGARLKVFGGRASGPKPLIELFDYTIHTFTKAAGRKLTSLECHDLACKIADAIVVGGVRRSALISLSNLSDQRMANAKNGQWWVEEPQRALANNSVSYTEKPDMTSFMKEWLTLMQSKSGERGIFNRVAARKLCESIGRDTNHEFGTNPCGEIILRPNEVCNLSEVVIRPTDTLNSLMEKVKVATILGTFQSTLTNYRYVRSIWKENAEEERLLGVSLTGIMDHPVLSQANHVTKEWLKVLRRTAVDTNAEWADKLGINHSKAITTIKPSGTVSQLVDSASGIHPRYSPYYIRAVRADKKDPLAIFMREKGFPVEDCVVKPDHTDVFYFPVMSPPGSVMRNDMTALQQLEHYMMFKRYWCDHNPSITVYVRDDEWMAVGDWVYNNFDDIGGVSFLPYSDHIYQQAPYTECTREEYLALKERVPYVNWNELTENEDQTIGAQELACRSGVCEI